jgi:hypothetical protein
MALVHNVLQSHVHAQMVAAAIDQLKEELFMR